MILLRCTRQLCFALKAFVSFVYIDARAVTRCGASRCDATRQIREPINEYNPRVRIKSVAKLRNRCQRLLTIFSSGDDGVCVISRRISAPTISQRTKSGPVRCLLNQMSFFSYSILSLHSAGSAGFRLGTSAKLEQFTVCRQVR